MSVITSIKPQKNKKKVNIYMDGKFAFAVDLETYMKRNLKIDGVLSEEDVGTIVKESEFQTTYDKILRFATIRPRSAKEFSNWLRKHKVHKSLHQELFNRLKHLEFLDDEKFAIWWIEQRQNFRPKSKRVLQQELRLKGIEKDVIDKVLESSGIDELNAAKNIIEKKRYRWEKFNGFERRRKIYGYLAQKGFNSSTIKDLLKEYAEN